MDVRHQMGITHRVFAIVISALLTIALACMVPVGDAHADVGLAAGAAQKQPVSKQTKKNGWKNTKSGKVYYRKGAKVVGLQKIGGKRYYFSPKGVLRTSDITVGGATFYIQDNGRIIGAKYGGKYYYDTLKPMTGDDSFDFDTFIWARSIVKSITGKHDSAETKRWKAFCWVRDKSYAIHQDFNPYQTNWPAVYARYHFGNQGGDCHSDGAAFAYLAAAIGYEADVSIDSMASGYAPSHCWTMIGGAVYDPLFYESKGSQYYGAWGTYQNNPTRSYRVPQYNSANNAGAAISKGLVNAGTIGLKKNANGKIYYFSGGKKLKKAWKTVNGKRYYFKGNGAAATYLTKVRGSYYLFNKNGVLQNSAKAGLRTVKMKNSKGVKTYYQVNKKGKTVAGWSKDGTKYANAKGVLYRNAWLTQGRKRYYFTGNCSRATYAAKIGGVYYVFDAAGVLQSGKVPVTATGEGAQASALVTVGGHTYRVDGAGRAVASPQGEWLTGDMKRFDATGKLLVGVWYIDKRFYAADNAGTYLPEATERLNAAVDGFAAKKMSAIELRRALDAAGAKLKTEIYSASCDKGIDYDGLWEYERFVIMTARSKAVKKLYDENGYRSVADAIAALDARARLGEGDSGAGESPKHGGEVGVDAEQGGAAEPGGEEVGSPTGGDSTPGDLIAPDGSYEYIRSITAL